LLLSVHTCAYCQFMYEFLSRFTYSRSLNAPTLAKFAIYSLFFFIKFHFRNGRVIHYGMQCGVTFLYSLTVQIFLLSLKGNDRMKASSISKRAKSANSASRSASNAAPSMSAPSSFREDYASSNSNHIFNHTEKGSPSRAQSHHSRSPSLGANPITTTNSLNGSASINANNEMLETKINRKRAESDLQLLANRFGGIFGHMVLLVTYFS
jgi:hypothetical protein